MVTREEPYIETGIAADLPFALESTLAPPPSDDFAKTITMADLYAGQGLVDEARDIYEDILARDPGNESVRAKLEALSTIVPESAPAEEEADDDYDDEAAPQAPTFESQPAAFAPEQPSAEEPLPFDDTAPFAESAPFAHAATAAPAALAATPNREKIARLEQWLAKVGRREVGHVQ